jgi:uncharacterized protein YdaU (DUF1376 family)
MKKSTKAWMPLYVGDFMADTATLSMEASGAYVQMLMYSWRTSKLPDDDRELARLCRMSVARFRTRIAPLLRALFVSEGGYLFNQRLESEREKANKNVQQKVAAQHARWEKKRASEAGNNNGLGDTAVSEPYASRNIPSPSPSPSKKDKRGASPLSESAPKPGSENSGRTDSLLPTATVIPFADDCREAVTMWNALARELSLPAVAKLTETRSRALRARLNDCDGLEGWKHALQLIRESPLLRGETTAWRCNFDFLISASGFLKVMEGNYASRPKPSAADGWQQVVDEFRSAGGYDQ